MLKRLILILFLATAILAGAPVMAGTISDAAVAQLRTKGYNKISVRRTLLGRIRIVADRDTVRREIVIHPLTGQILRDNLVSKTGNLIANTPEELDLGVDPNDGDNGGDDDGGDDDGGDDDGGDDDGGGDDGGGDDGGGDDGGGDGDGGDGDGDSGGDGEGGEGEGEGEGEGGED